MTIRVQYKKLCVIEEYSEVHVVATIIVRIVVVSKIPMKRINIQINKGNSKNCDYSAKYYDKTKILKVQKCRK